MRSAHMRQKACGICVEWAIFFFRELGARRWARAHFSPTKILNFHHQQKSRQCIFYFPQTFFCRVQSSLCGLRM